MSDQFRLLGLAARALDAQSYGLDVAGQNIANVNTPGYTRRSLQLGEVPPVDAYSAGGGVNVLAVTAARAPLIESRLRFEQPAAARESAIADHLSVVETALGRPGASLDAALSRFYNAYGALAQSPVSATARQQVIDEGQSLARSINVIAGHFDTARRAADADIRNSVDQINALAGQIARLNTAIGQAGASAEALRDQQGTALTALSKLVDVNAIERGDGGLDVTVGNGRALVVGANAYSLIASTTPPDGLAAIVSKGADVTTDVTGEITGGRVGGLLQVRDALVPRYADALDQLAYGVAGDVNALTRSGYDADGTAGTDFFVPPSSVTGAARLFAVRGAVAADPTLVVAAGSPTPGNNDVARDIAKLQDLPVTGMSTRPVDGWGDVVSAVATDAQSAAESRRSHEQIAQQLQTLRDEVSGVSLDEEAAMLLRFQRAYEANARFFTVADQTLDFLMQLVRT